MASYLVIKTGLSGIKLNDLYDAKVGDIALRGMHRLIGNSRAVILDICKQRGARGTMSVIGYETKAEVDELVKEYNKSILGLQRLNWQPVARIDEDIDVLIAGMKKLRKAAWAKLIEDGEIIATKTNSQGEMQQWQIPNFDKARFQTSSHYRAMVKRDQKDIMKFVRQASHKALDQHVVMIEAEKDA
jgi:hypothetical protein